MAEPQRPPKVFEVAFVGGPFCGISQPCTDEYLSKMAGRMRPDSPMWTNGQEVHFYRVDAFHGKPVFFYEGMETNGR